MQRYTIDVGGKEYVIDVQEFNESRFQVLVEGQQFEVHLKSYEDLIGETGIQHADTKEPSRKPITFQQTPTQPSSPPPTQPSSPRSVTSQREQSPIGQQQTYPCEPFDQTELVAPMPGTIVSILVAQGDTLHCGRVVILLEAMKMKNSLLSPQDGVVTAILVQEGQKVNTGDVLMRFAGEVSKSLEMKKE